VLAGRGAGGLSMLGFSMEGHPAAVAAHGRRRRSLLPLR
jgi:hypothetical protein